MREIKFRAWNVCLNEMIYMDSLKKRDCLSLIGEKSNNPLKFLQYTGLKDKNGKEIYEGDIVRILYTDWPSQQLNSEGSYSMDLDDYKDSISNIGNIIFSECEFCIQFNKDGYTGSIFSGTHGQITVIGNIYENSEFING